jgi:hypothetical protein
VRRYGYASSVEKSISRKIFQVATENPTRKIAEGNDMVKCGYSECDNHFNGYFNPHHVPETCARVTKKGETFYCCKTHMDLDN